MNGRFTYIGGKPYETCDVVMLPAKGIGSGIFLSTVYKELYFFDKRTSIEGAQHLYILSSEEIKEGDMVMNMYGNNKSIFRVTKILSGGYEGQKVGDKYCFYGLGKTLKKIVATTDSLYFGVHNEALNRPTFAVPRPSNDFIKKFVELQGIDKVLVEYRTDTYPQMFSTEVRVITTLKVADDNTITIKPIEVKNSWNQEELFLCMQYYMEYITNLSDNDYVTPQEWYNYHKQF